MKAVVYERFGGPEVFELREIAVPKPGPDEFLVRVRAAALNPKDILVSRGKFAWLSGKHFPRGLGYDWAGENVESGERLYGMVNGWMGKTCAEFAAVKPAECAAMPPSLSFEEASALPLAAQTALQALRDLGQVKSGSQVLINGASGGVGTLAIQIAKCLGSEVTTVSSQRNLQLCRELGADRTLDYRQEDPFAKGPEYDVVFDVFGNRNRDQAGAILKRSGIYITTVPKLSFPLDALKGWLSGPRAKLVKVQSRRKDLESLALDVAAGRLRPVLDRKFQLEEIVEAATYLGTRRARGKIVLLV